jgi:uncharacterized protein
MRHTVPDAEMCVDLNGETLALDPSGALWWPSRATLVMADIHLEKGSSYARRGALIPPYDTRATLKRIAEVVVRRKPRQVVALGDTFHDREAADRLDEEERETLLGLGRAADWIWIEGNHDPAPPAWLGGRVAPELTLGNLFFCHEPGVFARSGEVAGHLHPCTTVTRRGRSLRRRCFVSDGMRLVMPAFGAYAGGLDLWDRAIASLFQGEFGAYMLGTTRVYQVSGPLQSARRNASADSQPSDTAIATADSP